MRRSFKLDTLSNQEFKKLPIIIISFFHRPDGEKKAYVRLASDYDALDVANKVRTLLLQIYLLR